MKDLKQELKDLHDKLCMLLLGGFWHEADVVAQQIVDLTKAQSEKIKL